MLLRKTILDRLCAIWIILGTSTAIPPFSLSFPPTPPSPTPVKQLILGGARSGKSHLAEQLALASGLPVTYIATATIGDDEMAGRIHIHQQRRPVNWQLVEQPLDLAASLQATAAPRHCLLVDCLTLWLSNLLLSERPQQLAEQQAALLDTLPTLPGTILMVSNEVGLGIVPMNPQARQFRDLAGRLHQQLAGVCERVIFTVAGLPQVLKGPPIELHGTASEDRRR